MFCTLNDSVSNYNFPLHLSCMLTAWKYRPVNNRIWTYPNANWLPWTVGLMQINEWKKMNILCCDLSFSSLWRYRLFTSWEFFLQLLRNVLFQYRVSVVENLVLYHRTTAAPPMCNLRWSKNTGDDETIWKRENECSTLTTFCIWSTDVGVCGAFGRRLGGWRPAAWRRERGVGRTVRPAVVHVEAATATRHRDAGLRRQPPLDFVRPLLRLRLTVRRRKWRHDDVTAAAATQSQQLVDVERTDATLTGRWRRKSSAAMVCAYHFLYNTT